MSVGLCEEQLRVQWTPPDRSHTTLNTRSTLNCKQETRTRKFEKKRYDFFRLFVPRISVFCFLFFVFRLHCLLSWCGVRTCAYYKHVRTDSISEVFTTYVLSQHMNLHPASVPTLPLKFPAWHINGLCNSSLLRLLSYLLSLFVLLVIAAARSSVPTGGGN